MSNQSTAVVLPCTTDQFANFVSGLLGKAQTMSNSLEGPFEITKVEVVNVHHLLTQRVAQQNDGAMMQFTAKLVMNDNSSVLLNSIDDFNAYHEVKALACLSLHLSWTFLVKFNDKLHPEKQQIDLSFLTGRGPPVIDKDIPIISFGGNDRGYMAYRISHTARTWGSDMDSLLNAQLKNLVEDISPYKRWVAKHEGKLSVGTFCVLFLASLIATYISAAGFVVKQKAAIAALGVTSQAGGATERQLAYLLDSVATGTWEVFLLRSGLFVLLSFVVSLLIAMWVSASADTLPPSFLLLTTESEKRRARILKQRKRLWIAFCLAQLAALVVGVLGNVAYALWFGPAV